MRPEWFTNCSFDRCTLPPSLPFAALEARGNRVHETLTADESIY
jgi:hypothetical protein